MSDDVKTIFFVEDGEVELIAYRKVLERAGYFVQTAINGLEAMRLLQNIMPDLVLLDLVMPISSGVEVLKFIQSDSRLKTVPVVIFSTNSVIEARDELLLRGATKRLLKCQSNPTVVLETIREALAGGFNENAALADSHENHTHCE